MEAHLQSLHSQPLIADGFLAELATLDPAARPGDFSPETSAFLAMALPDICLELLAHRATARTVQITFDLDALEAARIGVIFHDRAPLSHLADACETITRLSPDSEERAAAADVLAQIAGAAL
jgi:hypothetical protein